MGLLELLKLKSKRIEGRVEGLEKVTGGGKYAAEYDIKNVCYGVLVGSNIASGRIKSIDTGKAKEVEGVIDVISHFHKPNVPGFAKDNNNKKLEFGLPIFHTDKVFFKGQPIAMVIAETLEDANFAASLIETDYINESFNVDFDNSKSKVQVKDDGKERGNTVEWENAEYLIDEEYNIKANVHNPMEMHATIAHWTGNNKIRIYDKNQGVNNVQSIVSNLFGIPKENIEVFSEFVGGGFGSGLRVWPATLAAIIAAKQVNRPVKLMLTRPQMFAATGYRPASWQRVKLGADSQGNFLGILHQAKNATSVYENFDDGITRITRLVYKVPNLKTQSSNVPLNLSTPTWMRGPGDCTGAFAIESAIDELSYKLNIDPVELRLKNISLDKHPDNALPWSTHFIDEGIHKGAEMIGWHQRKAVPGTLIDGDWHIGYGMSVGMWTAGRSEARVAIIMNKEGDILLQTAMTDIGTGTGTGMQNVAHEVTGVSKEKISIELGNSKLPPAPSQGGSTGLSSVAGAVFDASNKLKIKLADYAALVQESFKGVSLENIILSDLGISLKSKPSVMLSYKDLFEKNNLDKIHLEISSKPGDERKKFAFCCSSVHYCKVRVNKRTGQVKVEKLMVVADGGKIINNQAAANQMSGAAVGGIGMTLMEESLVDTTLGSLVANDLAGYHFAVNADAPIIEVQFINKPDFNSNPAGSKGLGEVGIIGTAPAISNAIYNAIGVRMRDLPITPDKILMSLKS